MKEYINNKQKNYYSHKQLTYLFEEGSNKKYLLVIFSAVNPPNQFSYNYISTLSYLPYNKLFILDNFGERGCYYLGENFDHSVETSVDSLINFYQSKYDILNKNTITIGSSKGGFAALYFGIKNCYGNIISGGPQTKLGDFLYDQGKVDSIIKYICKEKTPENKLKLNDIFYNMINQDNISIPNIYLHVSRNDHHYRNHVEPFINFIKERFKEYKLELDIMEYIGHDGLREYFPKYMCSKLSNILKYRVEEFYPFNKTEIIINDYINVKVDMVDSNDNYKFAYYLYKDGKIINKIYYIDKNIYKFELNGKGEYKCKVFAKKKDKKFITMTNVLEV